jgi:Ca-activated chloride channel family protein
MLERGVVVVVLFAVTLQLGCATASATAPAPVPAAATTPAPAPTVVSAPAPRPGSLTLIYVVDRSGSMHGAKIEALRGAITTSMGRLVTGDEVALIAFDSAPEAIFALTPAASQASVVAKVDTLEANGGTEFASPLGEAHKLMAGAHGARRHILFLSDGQAATEGVYEAIDAMHASGITVSTVGIGEADAVLLGEMARRGGGRFHQVTKVAQLPKIFDKDIALARGTP